MLYVTGARIRSHRPPGLKRGAWSEDTKIGSGLVFGRGNVRYRSREPEYGHNGNWGRKRGGWSEIVKMASGPVFCAIGHGSPNTVTPTTGVENVGDGPKP